MIPKLQVDGEVLNYINKLQFDDSGNEISLIE